MKLSLTESNSDLIQIKIGIKYKANNIELEMRTGRAGPLAGPGWAFKARGPKGPKILQDENKLKMKNQNFFKNYPKIFFFLKKIF